MATFEERTDTNFKKLFKIIEGNGQDGLIVKTDRNTQFRKFATRALWVLFGAVATYGAIFIVTGVKALAGN